VRIELQHINIQASPLRFRARLTYVRHHPYKVSLDIVFEYEHVKRLVRCPSDGREIDWHDLLIPFAFKHHMRHLCDICFGEILLLFKRSWSMVQCVHLDLDPDVVRTVAVLQRFRAEILDHFQRLQRSLRTLVEWTESQLGSYPKVSREDMGKMEYGRLLSFTRTSSSSSKVLFGEDSCFSRSSCNYSKGQYLLDTREEEQFLP
jgi:hypothetical protein